MGTTTPLGKPATRARIQNRQLAFRLDASQARQDSNLQPTVPKTVVLPIAPLAYTMRPMRPRWSRFARPITRWAPSAGAGGDGHCPPVRHHALLGLPRQGGCRRGLNMCPMPAVILTPNGWRTLRTRPGFEPGSPPTEGGVLPLHQQATHTPIKQGVRPECRIRFHRQRQGTVCVSSVLSAPSVGSLTQL